VTRHRISFALSLLGCLAIAAANVSATPSPKDAPPARVAAGGISGPTRLAQNQPPPPAQAPAPAASPSPAPAAATTTDEPIGNVATLTGTATVIRNKNSLALKLEDDVFMGDVLVTSANSALGVTFNDATTFNLTASARIEIDSFVYQDGGKQNGALFDIARGTVAFAAAAVAKTGDMRISTPTATLGIRGTTGLVEVPEGATATSANNVAIKLYPDADGRVGRIEVNGHDGSRLGSLTQGASGFTIRPGAGGRIAAVPLSISPQQALRDRGIVRQVHAAQNVGRQLVTQKQIQRQQNPARNNPAATPPRQPGLPKQNGLPKQPGSAPQPGLPKQNGLPKQPGSPNPSGLPKRTGEPKPMPPAPGGLPPAGQPKPTGQQQQQQPALPPPNAPGLREGGLQNKPALQKPKPFAPPKPKPPPKKRR
jgi:hypothetical protein